MLVVALSFIDILLVMLKLALHKNKKIYIGTIYIGNGCPYAASDDVLDGISFCFVCPTGCLWWDLGWIKVRQFFRIFVLFRLIKSCLSGKIWLCLGVQYV